MEYRSDVLENYANPGAVSLAHLRIQVAEQSLSHRTTIVVSAGPPSPLRNDRFIVSSYSITRKSHILLLCCNIIQGNDLLWTCHRLEWPLGVTADAGELAARRRGEWLPPKRDRPS